MSRRLLATAAVLASIAPAAAQTRQDTPPKPATVREVVPDPRIVFPQRVQQGAMVIGKVPAGSRVMLADAALAVTPYGSVVFGVGRDEKGPVTVAVTPPGGRLQQVSIAIDKREWPIQRINGVAPATVNPPPAVAARIARENAQIVAARKADSDGTGFAQAFAWPVQGRISGRFGNQRVYNGTPKSPHSGMDIAAGTGTAVKAPADGVVILAQPDFYLTCLLYTSPSPRD